MTSVRPEVSKVSTVSALLFLVFYSCVLMYFGVTEETIVLSAARSGAALTIIAAFWAFYNKWGWKYRLLRLGGWLCSTPDLNGRWARAVCRHQDDTPHPFVIEVSQTFSSLTFRTFSETSRGESIATSIYTDDNGTVFSVAAFWRTTTRRRDNNLVEDTFEGVS